jgi:hypothetical protein
VHTQSSFLRFTSTFFRLHLRTLFAIDHLHELISPVIDIDNLQLSI